MDTNVHGTESKNHTNICMAECTFWAENQLVGKNHFRDLRRAACTALMGDHKQASSIIACNAIVSRTSRSTFVCYNSIPEIFSSHLCLESPTCQRHVQFGKNSHGRTPVGPCGSLKKYLHKIGWSMDDNGLLRGPKGFLCNLFQASSQELCNIFKDGWTYYSYDLLKHRKGYLLNFIISQPHQKFTDLLTKRNKPFWH